MASLVDWCIFRFQSMNDEILRQKRKAASQSRKQQSNGHRDIEDDDSSLPSFHFLFGILNMIGNWHFEGQNNCSFLDIPWGAVASLCRLLRGRHRQRFFTSCQNKILNQNLSSKIPLESRWLDTETLFSSSRCSWSLLLYSKDHCKVIALSF